MTTGLMTLIGARHCASLLRNVYAYVHPVRRTSSRCTQLSNGKSLWIKFAAVSGLSAAGLWVCLNQAHCTSLSREARSAPALTRPFKYITLYQYRVSPYCSKTTAFMEYYGIPYEAVEVNPLWKRRMKLPGNKIPVVEVDGEKVKAMAQFTGGGGGGGGGGGNLVQKIQFPMSKKLCTFKNLFYFYF